jgi:hypothetical protein
MVTAPVPVTSYPGLRRETTLRATNLAFPEHPHSLQHVQRFEARRIDTLSMAACRRFFLSLFPL